MSKGKRIKIQFEQVGAGGVVTTSAMAATVQYASGDNVAVKGADGFIYQIDRNIRNENGSYVALA